MLKVENLQSGYHGVVILHGVTLEIGKDEVVSVIGRNGVGKSTFIKTVMGLVPAMQGTIQFEGKEIVQAKAHERARMGIGYVPQGHGVFPFLSVEENLKMGGMIAPGKAAEANIEQAYHFFPKLKDRRKQLAGTMSGGEQAMLSIGRVLAGNPSLLLLDEPSEGVQPNIVELMGDIINQINAEMGLTVLMVEQHMGLMQQISQRAYVMNKGVITCGLSRDELMDNALIQQHLSI